MKNRVKIAIVALAALGAVSGAQILTSTAYAQQGPEQGGPQGGPQGGGGFGGPQQGGGRQGGMRGPGVRNDTAKVSLTDAVTTATAKVSGYANEARLIGRPDSKQWVVHVVTKAASQSDRGAGKFVIVDAASNTVVSVADQMPRPPMGGPGGGGPGGPGGGPEQGGPGQGGPGGGGPGGGGPGEGGDSASTSLK